MVTGRGLLVVKNNLRGVVVLLLLVRARVVVVVRALVVVVRALVVVVGTLAVVVGTLVVVDVVFLSERGGEQRPGCCGEQPQPWGH